MTFQSDFEFIRPGRSHLIAVRFTYTRPAVNSVEVAGTFNQWQPGAGKLRRADATHWVSELGLLPGRYEYRWVVDGVWMQDPESDESVPNPYGGRNSVLRVVSPIPLSVPPRPAVHASVPEGGELETVRRPRLPGLRRESRVPVSA